VGCAFVGLVDFLVFVLQLRQWTLQFGVFRLQLGDTFS